MTGGATNNYGIKIAAPTGGATINRAIDVAAGLMTVDGVGNIGARNLSGNGEMHPQTGMGGTAFLTISQTCYFRYWGQATKAYTSCKFLFNVTVGGAGSETYTEAGVYKTTTPPFITGTTPGLTRVGTVAMTFSTTTGIKTGTATGMTIIAGDELWVCFSAQRSSTMPTMTAPQLDVFASGNYASQATIRPTTAATAAPTAIATGLPAIIAQFS